MPKGDRGRASRSSPRIAGIGSMLALAATFVALSGTDEALAYHPSSQTAGGDTVKKGAAAEQRGIVSAAHLNRTVERVEGVEAVDTTRVVIEIDIRPPSEEDRAGVYALRYGISNELSLQIIRSALAEGVDPELGFRLIRVESVFKPNARGPSGSLGLTQLQPSTARAIDPSLRTEAQILEPEANLRTGFRYLHRLLDRYKGDVRLAVLAYNRGETAVDRALRAGRDPENGYSKKVLSLSGSTYTGSGTYPKP